MPTSKVFNDAIQDGIVAGVKEHVTDLVVDADPEEIAKLVDELGSVAPGFYNRHLGITGATTHGYGPK